MPTITSKGDKRTTTVRIKRMDEAERIVYGEVYAPNRLDTYGEYMTAEDIKLMAHRAMKLDLAVIIDTQHDNVPNGSYPVESFIARAGDVDYTEGAWVLGVKVPDDATWNKVIKGDLNGFSYEAWVTPQETEITYYVMRDHVGSVEPALDHEHTYFVQMGSDGKVIKGWTSPGPDGHVHTISKASVTDSAADHNHRFFL